MKILIVVHSLTGGGAERVAVSWANGLSRLGHDIAVLADTYGQTYQLNNGITLIERSTVAGRSMSFFSKLRRKLFRPFVDFLQYWKLFRTNPPDALVNVLYMSAYPILIARLLSFRKFPIIMTDHNAYERPKGTKLKWHQWRNKFIDNYFFDCITVLTHRDKEILDNHGIKKALVLHNPLFLKPVTGILNKKKIVLSVGRIDQWQCKGFDILIKAWSKIASAYPEWKLRIVGNGKNETIAWLKNLAMDTIPSIEFIDYTSNIEEFYREASIYIMPSRYEGWGLVAVEAMSQGCATIACDYKGRQAEYIDNGVNGILCDTDDVDKLADRIAFLIKNDDIRHRLQQSAPLTVEKFSEDIVAKNLEQIIVKVKR